MASVSRREKGRPALRQGGLRRRLVLAFGGTSAALIVAALLPLGFLLVRSHFSQYADQHERQARSAALAVAANPGNAAAEVAARYPPGSELEGILLDRTGQPLTLVLDPDLFPKIATRSPEVRIALSGTTAARAGTTQSGRRLLVAAPVVRRGRVDGALWSSAPLDPVDELNRGTWASLGIIGASAILFAIVVAMAVSRQIARRLETVAAGAERFAEGRFGEPIHVGGGDEVEQLGSRLNEMARRIERLVALERDFAAAASHQLRTPLTAIKLRIEELRSLLPAAEGIAAEYLDEMGEEVDRLTVLTSGLLMLAATEGGVAPENLPAAAAVEQAVGRLRPLAKQGEVAIDVKENAQAAVRAAPGAFEEVLFNILDNAVKYSHRGGVVEVRTAAEDGFLHVTVGDRGVGLSAEEAEHVFEPFFRSRRMRSVGGSGLGLTICARLCEVSGASIALQPREGGGTEADMRWPLASTES